MKFLLVLSVFAIAFSSEAEAFFFKKAEFKGQASGDLDGLANLITLPLQIKSKIIEAKKAKINAILGALSGLSGKLSVHGSSGGDFGGHGSSGGDFGGHGSSGGDFSGSFTSGSSASSGAASSSGSSTFQGGEVYHPEPAPSAQYSQQPVIIHLYQQAPAPVQSQVQAQVQSHAQSYQPAPAPVQEVYHPAPAPVQHHVQAQFQAHYEPAPAPVQQVYQPAPVQQTYQPAPAPVQQVYQPAPAPIQEVHHVSKPENTYGPPNYQPPAPISSGSGSSSYVQSVDNTYLPPHSH